MKKNIFIGIAVLVIAAGLYAYNEYNRKNKDLAHVSADFKLRGADLIFEFMQNEEAANKKFLDKVVQVDGTVKEVTKNEKGFYTIALGNKDDMSSVRCSMDSIHQGDAAKQVVGNNITIKGVCTGYNADELLGSDVILNRCVIVK